MKKIEMNFLKEDTSQFLIGRVCRVASLERNVTRNTRSPGLRKEAMICHEEVEDIQQWTKIYREVEYGTKILAEEESVMTVQKTIL